MRTTDVVAHFGNQSAVARALDISDAAVSKWDDIVPETSAYKLHVITNGKLKADPELYARLKRQRTN